MSSVLPKEVIANVEPGSIGSVELADGSVTESKLGTGAVTEDKLGAGAVTGDKIGDEVITISHLIERLRLMTQGSFARAPVRVLADSNVNTTGGAPTVVDGITLQMGDRVLCTGQTDPIDNGIRVVSVLGTGSNGTWLRAPDASEDGDIVCGSKVIVQQGTTHGGETWVQRTIGVIEIDVDDQDWQEDQSSIAPGGVRVTDLEDIAGASVLGNPNATTGAVEVITGSPGDVLQVNVGGELVFAPVESSGDRNIFNTVQAATELLRPDWATMVAIFGRGPGGGGGGGRGDPAAGTAHGGGGGGGSGCVASWVGPAVNLGAALYVTIEDGGAGGAGTNNATTASSGSPGGNCFVATKPGAASLLATACMLLYLDGGSGGGGGGTGGGAGGGGGTAFASTGGTPQHLGIWQSKAGGSGSTGGAGISPGGSYDLGNMELPVTGGRGGGGITAGGGTTAAGGFVNASGLTHPIAQAAGTAGTTGGNGADGQDTGAGGDTAITTGGSGGGAGTAGNGGNGGAGASGSGGGGGGASNGGTGGTGGKGGIGYIEIVWM